MTRGSPPRASAPARSAPRYTRRRERPGRSRTCPCRRPRGAAPRPRGIGRRRRPCVQSPTPRAAARPSPSTRACRPSSPWRVHRPTTVALSGRSDAAIWTWLGPSGRGTLRTFGGSPGPALLGGEMSRHRVRIVVGEGRSARMGFLRFVLESEGYDVVAQASSAGELARVLAVHRPDVVVLDDGIGATAVQMTHDVSPGAKVILVWPGAVVPVGGYARVDPDDVLRSLGPTVARAFGTMAAPPESVIASDWTDRVKKDPAALRETLEEYGDPSTRHPGVTELKRRGQHLHPVADTR